MNETSKLCLCFALIESDSLPTARAAAIEQGVQNVEFKQGDAKDLSNLEAESFDIVHAHQVLLHLSKPISVMQEMRRIVKIGGILSTRDCVRRVLAPPVPKLVEHLDRFMDYARSKRSDPDFGQTHHEAARAADFDGLTLRRVLGVLKSPDPAKIRGP